MSGAVWYGGRAASDRCILPVCGMQDQTGGLAGFQRNQRVLGVARQQRVVECGRGADCQQTGLDGPVAVWVAGFGVEAGNAGHGQFMAQQLQAQTIGGSW